MNYRPSRSRCAREDVGAVLACGAPTVSKARPDEQVARSVPVQIAQPRDWLAKERSLAYERRRQHVERDRLRLVQRLRFIGGRTNGRWPYASAARRDLLPAGSARTRVQSPPGQYLPPDCRCRYRPGTGTTGLLLAPEAKRGCGDSAGTGRLLSTLIPCAMSLLCTAPLL